MALYLLMISLTITAATAAPTCQLSQQSSCCQDCMARHKLCQSNSNGLQETTDCIRYHQQCQKKCDNQFKGQALKPAQSKTSPIPPTTENQQLQPSV